MIKSHFLVLLLSISVTDCRRDLLQTLLDDSIYDAALPPTYALDNPIPTNVTVQFYITNIHNVRESQMDYEVDMFFRQKWVDHRLRHNASDGVLELDTNAIDGVWIPDTYFDNAKSGYLHVVTVPNKMLHIYSDGSILYSIHLNLKLSCSMFLSKYPLEEQDCPIRIESYAYSAKVVHYVWNENNPVIIGKSIEMPKFEYSEEVQSGRCDAYYEGVGTFSCIETHIHLTRKIGFFVLQLFVPSILIVALSWVSFWIDYESVPARISLGLLTVLTMTTQTSSFKDTLPHVSYVKAADVWLAACLIFVFLALLEYAYVNKLARSIKKNPEDKNAESDPTNGTPVESTDSLASKTAFSHGRAMANRMDHISRFLFPLLFIVFNVVFWAYYLQ